MWTKKTDTNMANIAGKKVLVVGMGKSGIAATQALVTLNAEVFVQDSKPVEKINPQLAAYLEQKNIVCFFGKLPEDIGIFDIIVLSPGVPTDLPFIREASEKGVEIIGELEIAYRLSKGTYVAITGTNGKTTTTTLTGMIFNEAKRKTSVAGNIGIAVISEAVKSTEEQWMVTEVSSFQLETIKYFKPKVSAILNLTPDHLNRHKTMKGYKDAKARIFENQSSSDYLIINYDDKECLKLADQSKAVVVPFSRLEKLEFGAYIDGNEIVIRDEEKNISTICSLDDIKIIGNHNIENVLAAAAISFFSGITPEVIAETIRKFHGVEHRIEFCGTVDGVTFYNDSKGTNVDASIVALKALKNNILLIAGGDGKDQDFTELAEAFTGRVKKLILLGRDAGKIETCARKAGFTDIYYGKDMNECVKKAMELSDSEDNVLLSPACASWDMYDNYEQRGKHFKDCVDQLLK